MRTIRLILLLAACAAIFAVALIPEPSIAAQCKGDMDPCDSNDECCSNYCGEIGTGEPPFELDVCIGDSPDP